MIVLSMAQCVALLSVSFFILGIIVDRMAIWFYNRYVVPDDDDDQAAEDECYQEAI